MGLKVPVGGGVWLDSEVLELERQIQQGDAVSGWRGDPDMTVRLVQRPEPGEIQVWGVDKYQRPYVAASVPGGTPGWRHKLLDKLVQGDWQKRAGSLHEKVMANNMRLRQEQEDSYRDFLVNEFAPKLRWALQKDGVIANDTFYMNRKDKR